MRNSCWLFCRSLLHRMLMVLDSGLKLCPNLLVCSRCNWCNSIFQLKYCKCFVKLNNTFFCFLEFKVLYPNKILNLGNIFVLKLETKTSLYYNYHYPLIWNSLIILFTFREKREKDNVIICLKKLNVYSLKNKKDFFFFFILFFLYHFRQFGRHSKLTFL